MKKKIYAALFFTIIFSVLFAAGLAMAAQMQDNSGYGCMNTPEGMMNCGVCGCTKVSGGAAGCMKMPGGCRCNMGMPGGMGMMGAGRMGGMMGMGGMKMMGRRMEVMSAIGVAAGPAISPFGSTMAKEIMQDPEVKQFLDKTKNLRLELVQKRFNYYEALRNPATKPEQIIAMRKELRRLQKEIWDKSPFKAGGLCGPRGAGWDTGAGSQ
ncbi:MAG: hypothetical protein M0018_12400 [Nitrospiraceae bacterium]|nr:hypothetical protein [Nitrospiraceae bacterium]